MRWCCRESVVPIMRCSRITRRKRRQWKLSTHNNKTHTHTRFGQTHKAHRLVDMMSIYWWPMSERVFILFSIIITNSNKNQTAQREREGERDTYWILFDLRCLNWNPQPFWLVVRCGQIIRNSVTILLKCLTTANNSRLTKHTHHHRVHSNDRFNLLPWFFLSPLSLSLAHSVSLEWRLRWWLRMNNEFIRISNAERKSADVSSNKNQTIDGWAYLHLRLRWISLYGMHAHSSHTDTTNGNAQILALDRRNGIETLEPNAFSIWWAR